MYSDSKNAGSAFYNFSGFAKPDESSKPDILIG